MKNNQAKFDYIVSHWELRDGVIYRRDTHEAVSFGSKNQHGYRHHVVKFNGKKMNIRPHEAVWMFYHNRPIPDGDFHIHHIDLNPANNAPDNLILMSPRMHRLYHTYITDSKGCTFNAAPQSHRAPWMAQVRLPIGRVIRKCFATEQEATAFVAYHRTPLIKAFQAMGLPLPQPEAGNAPQASRTIPPVRQSEMR